MGNNSRNEDPSDNTPSEAILKDRSQGVDPLAVFRGSESCPPVMEAAEKSKSGQRVLAVAIHFEWSEEESKALYQRLRDLGWQAARYRNAFSVGLYAQRMGWRVTEEEDRNSVSKEVRATRKEQLSGAAYSAAEREVAAAFARDGKRIMAGQPPPQWRTNAALSVRGHKNRKESGIRLEYENGAFVAYLQAQCATSPGGSWLRLPIKKNTRRDEYQAPILNAMVSWKIPIAKATVQMKAHGAILRLTYAADKSALPAMGQRVATLGPLRDGKLLLRTETQTKDYTSKLATILARKDDWDLIRRRVTAQIGRRKGHARAKRERLARLSWDDWLKTALHTWSREMVDWCTSQGVGFIAVETISGDWPADQFIALLRYKASDAGIELRTGADLTEESGSRAAKAAVATQQKRVSRRRNAERTLRTELAS